MPDNVIQMNGYPLHTAADILRMFADRDDIKHVVVVALRDDNMSEIAYDRQTYSEVILASAQLNTVAQEMAKETVDRFE